MKDTDNAPFHGFPATRQIADDEGRPAFIITPRALTPAREMIADVSATLSTLILGAVALFYLYSQGAANEAAAAALLATPFLAHRPLTVLLRFALRKKTHVLLTADSFVLKRWKGRKTYDRTQPHSFAPLAHDKVQAEAKRLEHRTRQAQAEGEIISPKAYLAESFHLVLILAGQRIDIATIFGRKDAQAALARLKLCDGVLDAYCGMNGGLALSPDHEATPAPGELPLG